MHAAEFILHVADQGRAREFYRHVLAADPVLDVPGMTGFDLGGAMLGLMPGADLVELLPGRIRTDGDTQRCELYLRRADAEAALARATAAGGTLVDGLADRPWGERVAYLLDPDGHVLALALPRAGHRVRPAVPADAEAVAAVWASGWREAHLGQVPQALLRARTPASFGTRAAARVPDTLVAVAVEGGAVEGGREEVAGFVMVTDDEVEQVYVAGGHRGTDVAATLLAAAERRIAAAGHARAWLAVVPGNTRARRFYERRGWRDDGLFEHAAPTDDGAVPVPCHRYVKVLTPTA